MPQLFAEVGIDQVQSYWDRRPCNLRHSQKEVGSRGYFDEVEQRKYFVEPHIPSFADFPRWQGKKVLEIGCGMGTDTINFARHGAQVMAVDLSEKSLELAKERAKVYGLSRRIRFVRGNAEGLSSVLSPEQFDLVYSFGVIHHTPSPHRVLQQLKAFVHSESTLKLMVYHRRAWKVLWLLMTEGRGKSETLAEMIARHSEAQTGCPVTYTYTRREARRLLEEQGFRVENMFVDHIFPYRVADYVQHRYQREWYFRGLPNWLFRRLERSFGWHLCLTATCLQPVSDHVSAGRFLAA